MNRIWQHPLGVSSFAPVARVPLDERFLREPGSRPAAPPRRPTPPAPRRDEPSRPVPEARPAARGTLDVRLRYWRSVAGIYLRQNKKIFFLGDAEMRAYVEIIANGWFDRHWYLATYPDVAKCAVDPLHHLIRHGLYEGRSPCAAFQSRLDVGDPAVDGARRAYLAAIAPLLTPTQAGAAAVIDRGHLRRFSNDLVDRAVGRLERFPLFKADSYFELNPTLETAPGLLAHRHALTYGFAEGRPVFDKHVIANELGLRSRAAPASARADARDSRRLPISVAYNASGNTFLREIAACLVFDLKAAGHDVELIDETADIASTKRHLVIVAPHEFFFLGRGKEWVRDDVLRKAVLLNTEQPQTLWFDRAAPYSLLAKAVIDLTPQLAAIYSDCMPALFFDPAGPRGRDRLPPADDPILRVLPAAAKTLGSRSSDTASRAIDVSFFGGASTHRETFFAKTARFFADYDTLFYCRRALTPLFSDAKVDLVEAARHVGFHSKIVLNIHREAFGFFEWHRVVKLGMETGAVVVSEPCLPHPEVRPGVHYFEESGRHIQNLVEWLLRTPDGQAEHAKVRAAASAYVDARRAGQDAGHRIGRFLEMLEEAGA